MIRAEKEDCSTPETNCTSTMVLQIDGDGYEFELLTEDEMLALAEMPEDPLPSLDDLRKLSDISDKSLIAILPARQIDDLEASNLGD